MTSATTLGLLAIWLGPPAAVSSDAEPPAITSVEQPVGLVFDPAIPEHDRGPLQLGFDRTLALACPDHPPCTDDCEDDQTRLGLALTGQSRDYTLRWVADDPRLEQPLIQTSHCELCSLVELEQQFATDLGRLCPQLDALDAGPGQLELSSDPTRARLRIDGLARGRTPWTGELAAGEHTIELRALGHRPHRQHLAIRANVTTHTHLSLVPNAFARGPRPTWPAWASLGLGVALSVAGTALIAIDDRPWQGRCSGDDIDDAGNCRFVLATRPLGIGLAVLGAGALASGVGLMVWAQRGDTHTCAGIQASGRF
jgi:hypothetical protein